MFRRFLRHKIIRDKDLLLTFSKPPLFPRLLPRTSVGNVKIGFVFAAPNRSILIQPSELTRFASIPNWLCLALFSVPGPPQRERPDTPVPSACCCCLLRSRPSSPRTRHPPGPPPSAIWPSPSAIYHSPLATRRSSGPLDTRCPVSGSAGPIPRQSGP